MEKNQKFKFNLKIDRDKSKDTGLAMILILLLLYIWKDNFVFICLAIIFIIAVLVIPGSLKPLAYIWFGLAHILGTIMSKILLSIVFFLVVLPIAILRRLKGKDSLRLKQWKKSMESVFITRNHQYTSSDIQKPY
ncbi:MAG: hypothetical protein K9H58_15405 [Bacteroidales bacterium]|nr:hypothetical protein [Bacteroidales bacterium]